MKRTLLEASLQCVLACISLFACFAVTRAADSTAAETSGRPTLIVAPDESEAIVEIEKLGGTVIRDDRDPLRPASAVYLQKQKEPRAALEIVQRLKQLRKLDLYCANVTDAEMQYLNGLTQLETLVVAGCKFTDAGLANLRRMKKLETLDLSGCSKVTDAGLKNLDSLPQLQTLNISGCPEISSAGLASLKDLSRLRTLRLRGRRCVSDDDLREIVNLAHLKRA